MPRRRSAPLLLLLLAPLACAAPDRPDAGPASSGAPEGGPVLALFPLENRSPAADQAYFAAGVRQELMVRLASLEGIRVLTPRSADLQVGYGVNGAVLRDGPRVEIELSVTRLSDGDTLWSGAVQGERGNLFALQGELVEAVATAVGRTLSAPEREAAARAPTRVPVAHDLYLRGHDLGHRGEASDQAGRERAWRQAVPLFQEAAELDPGYVGAWAGLAFHHLRLSWFGYDRSADRLARARAALDRAEALDPNDPEVLVTQGYWHYWGRLDYPRAVERYRAAQDRLPGDTRLSTLIAYVLRRQGDMEEAVRLLSANSDLDPTDPALALEAGDTWHSLLEWDLARRYLERARALAPDHPSAWLSLGWVALAESGDTEAARRWFDDGARRAGEENFLFARWRLAMLERRYDEALAIADGALAAGTEAFVLPIVLVPVDQMAGFALRGLGREEEARGRFQAAARLLERLAPEYGGDHRIERARALGHAALGNRTEALAAADRGVAARPLEVDAFVGGDPVKDRAWVRTLVGDVDGALDDLERMVGAPTLVPLTPALLRLDPRWDPLREEPRFRALVGGGPGP